jgi:hypothetical protein
MNSLIIESLDNFRVQIKQFTLIGAIRFMGNMNSELPLSQLHHFLLKATNIDDRQVKQISLQDAITILISYRMFFDNIFPIVEHPKILASDLLQHEKRTPPETILIGDYRFTPKLSLSNAIEAESTAHQRGDSHFLAYYLIAMSCTKGFKEGWETLLSLQDDAIGRGQIIHYNQEFGNIGVAKLDLLKDSVRGGKIYKDLSILTGGDAIAIGFQGSNLLIFGL